MRLTTCGGYGVSHTQRHRTYRQCVTSTNQKTKLTQAGGGLAAKVHSVQAHCALGGPHVEPHGEVVGRGVVAPVPLALAVLHATAVL